MNAMLALFRRDVRLALRQGGGVGLGLGFFVLVAVLLPLGVGRDLVLLERLAPGLIWLGAALASLLSLDHLFQADLEDGSLDLFFFSSAPIEALVLAKVAAHWLTAGLPLALASPLLAVLLNLDVGDWGPLVLSLLIGTPALSLLGAGAAGVTAGLRRGGLLLSLLTLPLYVPVLIFGAAAATAGVGSPAMLLLGGITLFSLVVGTAAAALGLRLHVS
jgi:heme exporter protein B